MDVKLNLLPPEKKEEIIFKNNLRTVFRVEAILFLSIILFGGVIGCFKYALNLNFASYTQVAKEKSVEERENKLKDYSEKFSQANSNIVKIEKIKNDQLYWSFLLEKINRIVFSGIKADSIKTFNYSVSFFGQSNTREDIVLFKEEMEKETCFYDIKLPFSNLVDKKDIEFQMDFKIKEECLKTNGKN
jgi:hypothetical protein